MRKRRFKEDKEYCKEWRKKHPGYSTERYRNFSREEKKRQIEKTIKNDVKRQKRYRNEIIDLLGSRCIRCGYTDRRALQIDHIFGQGRKDQRNHKKNYLKYYLDILNKIKAGSKDYQILCANCNWIKRFENQEGGYKDRIAVTASGYFNPLHSGHLSYIREAKKLGDKLIVIVNNDAQVLLKSGYIFMSESERMDIIRSLKWVDEVVLSVDEDNTVCKTLEKIRPNILAKGGDRFAKEIPEKDVCDKLNIQIIDKVGNNKTQSSSWILKDFEEWFKIKFKNKASEKPVSMI